MLAALSFGVLIVVILGRTFFFGRGFFSVGLKLKNLNCKSNLIYLIYHILSFEVVIVKGI